MKPTVQHYPNCNPNYPEKVPGEKPQQLSRVDIGDGEVVYTCVDCGAYIMVEENGN